jgi:hypothetical protein
MDHSILQQLRNAQQGLQSGADTVLLSSMAYLNPTKPFSDQAAAAAAISAGLRPLSSSQPSTAPNTPARTALVNSLDASLRGTPTGDAIVAAWYVSLRDCYIGLLKAELQGSRTPRTLSGTEEMQVRAMIDGMRQRQELWISDAVSRTSASATTSLQALASPPPQVTAATPPASLKDVLATNSVATQSLLKSVMRPCATMFVYAKLSKSANMDLQTQLMSKYLLSKASQNAMAKLSRSGLEAAMRAVAVDSSPVQADTVVRSAHAEAVRNKVDSVTLKKQSEGVQDRASRAGDTQVTLQVMQADLSQRRREFLLWALAYVLVVAASVYLIYNKMFAPFVLMALLVLFLLTLASVIAYSNGRWSRLT